MTIYATYIQVQREGLCSVSLHGSLESARAAFHDLTERYARDHAGSRVVLEGPVTFGKELARFDAPIVARFECGKGV